MVAASANLFPKVILEEVASDGSATATPSADHRAIFLGEDGELHAKDSAAAVTDLTGGAGSAGGDELNYTEFTSPVTVSATTAAGADTVVTASAAVDRTVPVEIEFFSPAVTVAATNGSQVILLLIEDGTQIGVLGQYKSNGATTTGILPVTLKRRLATSTGTKTYAVKAYRVTANGTVGAGAGGADPAYVPAYIRITNAS